MSKNSKNLKKLKKLKKILFVITIILFFMVILYGYFILKLNIYELITLVLILLFYIYAWI